MLLEEHLLGFDARHLFVIPAEKQGYLEKPHKGFDYFGNRLLWWCELRKISGVSKNYSTWVRFQPKALELTRKWNAARSRAFVVKCVGHTSSAGLIQPARSPIVRNRLVEVNKMGGKLMQIKPPSTQYQPQEVTSHRSTVSTQTW